MALIQNSFSTSTLSFHEGKEEEEKEARSSVVFLTSAKIDCSVDTRHSVAYRNRNQTQINSSPDAALCGGGGEKIIKITKIKRKKKKEKRKEKELKRTKKDKIKLKKLTIEERDELLSGPLDSEGEGNGGEAANSIQTKTDLFVVELLNENSDGV